MAAAARWRTLRGETLAALRDLRAEQEPQIQSPDLTRAALFLVPRADEVPERPEWEGRADGVPHPLDRSEAAELWRERMASRLDALRLRRAHRQAMPGLRPHRTWARIVSGADRGGPVAGQSAYPAGWNGYLLRIDPDGISGDGWASPLGVAWKRMERAYAETKLLRAVWAYTDPRGGFDMRRVWRELGVGKSQAYRWLDAGAKRLVAEVRLVALGRERAREELRDAEIAEAEAWRAETRARTREKREAVDG